MLLQEIVQQDNKTTILAIDAADNQPQKHH